MTKNDRQFGQTNKITELLTNRPTHTQTDEQTNTQTEEQLERQKHEQVDYLESISTDIVYEQTDIQTDKQTAGQKNGQIDNQTNIYIDRKRSDIWTHRRTTFIERDGLQRQGVIPSSSTP